MRGAAQRQPALIWFAGKGWWFKAFNQHFGPYPELNEARYHFLVLQGLSRQLYSAISR